MAANVSGRNNQVIPQAEEQGTMDRFGVDTLTRVEEIPKDMFPASMRRIGSIHPVFWDMQVQKVNYSVAKHGKFYRVTYIYEGFLTTIPDPTYDLEIGVSEDPIQTHEGFKAFAGTPSTPINGSIFINPETNQPTEDNATGIWREFKFDPAATGKQPKAGVDSFVIPNLMWVETSFTTTRPTGLGNVGKIDSPSGPNPTPGDGATWLLWSATYRKRGAIYETRKSWKASGPGGWDTDIYGP